MLLQGANKPLAIPYAVDFHQWESILVALDDTMMIAGPAPSAGQVAKTVKIGERTVVANLPFLKALGMVTDDSTASRITPGMTGMLYASAVAAGDAQGQQNILYECSRRGLRPVVRFCEVDDELNFDRLFMQIKFLARVGDSWGQHRDTAGPYRTGIYTAMAILVHAGIVGTQFLPTFSRKDNGDGNRRNYRRKHTVKRR